MLLYLLLLIKKGMVISGHIRLSITAVKVPAGRCIKHIWVNQYQLPWCPGALGIYKINGGGGVLH
jgi:hypothetical protein